MIGIFAARASDTEALFSRSRLTVESVNQHLACLHATYIKEKLLLASSRTLATKTHTGVDDRFETCRGF